MCVLSYVGDQYRDNFPERWPSINPYITIQPIAPEGFHPFQMIQDDVRHCVVCGNERSHDVHSLFEYGNTSDPEEAGPSISPEEFAALKAEVETLKELLLAAKAYDEATGQADCEMEAKIAFVRWVADLVGVDVDEVFGARP